MEVYWRGIRVLLGPGENIDLSSLLDAAKHSTATSPQVISKLSHDLPLWYSVHSLGQYAAQRCVDIELPNKI